jgi:hypothetical protein
VTDRPGLGRNPTSIAGVWLTTLGGFAFITYYVTEALGLVRSPYAGLLGFVVIPAVFVVGLLLIPYGVWREARRRKRGKEPWAWPVIHLERGRTRQVIAAIFLLTLANLAIVTVATVGAVHYMETDQFCGQVCHTPMKPEFAAHLSSPHAGVSCVSCHIGPGAGGAVRAKMNGARQAYEFLTGRFARPIPSPARNLPSPVETCVRCHALDQMPAERALVKHEYADDEANTDTPSPIVMFTKAAHWHARPDLSIEFVATDATRSTIPYVRVTEAGGTVEYFAEGVTTRPPGEVRRMDCLDCHSRPAHTMSASAEQAVDRAIAAGELSRDLPFVRREAVAALKVGYPDENAAGEALRKRMTDLYATTKPAPLVAGAAATLERLYRSNVFPAMKVTWGTYTSQSGHAELSGCFRCHDDSHKALSGKLIRQDCEICHKVE